MDEIIPFKWVDTVDSTSTLLHRMASGGVLPHGYGVGAREQTAGRGQRGNHWVVQPGANATFSVFLRPVAVSAALQFDLSRMVSLAVCDVLDYYIPAELRPHLKVKWPNDIYFDNNKMGGIIIENSLYGDRVESSIVGVGVNVRQRRWDAGAPNATSLALALGCGDEDLPTQREVSRAMQVKIVRDTAGEYDAEALRTRYMARLWRNDGAIYRWLPGPLPTQFCPDPSGALPFEAAVSDVLPCGHLCLRTAHGTPLPPFAFKEVTPLL